MKKIVTFIATGAWFGYSPYAPGTVGTLWGATIVFLTASWPLYAKAATIAASFAVSVIAAGQAEKFFAGKDPSQIVCDEVCGFLAAFFLIPFTVFNLILVFILFRFFDIVKPYPINSIDKRLGGGLGITLDDVMAGVYANLTAHMIITVLSR
ncbi:MAG: phosphatidylglycerophosphatase A [Deltaproteobacteria bacterium]|nr:phosphatidylglycerophosphatase A [Deltaproteobacteria bacterium]